MFYKLISKLYKIVEFLWYFIFILVETITFGSLFAVKDTNVFNKLKSNYIVDIEKYVLYLNSIYGMLIGIILILLNCR